MEDIPTRRARSEFADVVNRVAYGKERVVLTRRGKQLAAVVPIEDLRLIEELEDQRDIERARAALQQAATAGTLSLSEVKARLRR